MALTKILSRNYRRYDPCPEQAEHDQMPNGGYSPIHAVSIGCFIKGSHSSVDQHCIGTSRVGYRLFLKSVAGLSYLAATIGHEELVDPAPIDPSEWIYGTLVWNGSTATLYKDGTPVDYIFISKISYVTSGYGNSIWAFSNTLGGNSYQMSLNSFTVWGAAIDPDSVMYMANGGNPIEVNEEDIRLGDFMDDINMSAVYGDFYPCNVENDGIVNNPDSSPFPGGVVPWPVPIVINSSSTSSTSSSSTSSSSSSSSSSDSSESLSSISDSYPSDTSSTSSVSESRSSSSEDIFKAFFDVPGEYILSIPSDVFFVDARLWGGGGGGYHGYAKSDAWGVKMTYGNGAAGGGGSYVDDRVPVTPGSILRVIVGAGGKGSSFTLDTEGQQGESSRVINEPINPSSSTSSSSESAMLSDSSLSDQTGSDDSSTSSDPFSQSSVSTDSASESTPSTQSDESLASESSPTSSSQSSIDANLLLEAGGGFGGLRGDKQNDVAGIGGQGGTVEIGSGSNGKSGENGNILICNTAYNEEFDRLKPDCEPEPTAIGGQSGFGNYAKGGDGGAYFVKDPDFCFLNMEGGNQGFCEDYAVYPSHWGSKVRATFNSLSSDNRLVMAVNPVDPCSDESPDPAVVSLPDFTVSGEGSIDYAIPKKGYYSIFYEEGAIQSEPDDWNTGIQYSLDNGATWLDGAKPRSGISSALAEQIALSWGEPFEKIRANFQFYAPGAMIVKFRFRGVEESSSSTTGSSASDSTMSDSTDTSSVDDSSLSSDDSSSTGSTASLSTDTSSMSESTESSTETSSTSPTSFSSRSSSSGVQFVTHSVQYAGISPISGLQILDTDCVGPDGSPTVVEAEIPEGTEVVRVLVIPNCTGANNSDWNLFLGCFNLPNVQGIDPGVDGMPGRVEIRYQLELSSSTSSSSSSESSVSS